MGNFYADNMNIRKINGFTLQQTAHNVWAIDEFGIDIIYLIIGTKRALLIDTGIGLGNLRAIVETMTDLPYDVVNTHHHYDHVGGNGHFDQVYAHKIAVSIIQEQNTPKSREEFFISQESRSEYDHCASLRYDRKPLGYFEIRELQEGYRFDLGDRILEVIETPGHTKDGICLLDTDNRLLFSGDTIVSTPTLMFDTFSDTMSVYLKSLEKLKSRREEYELIFPGHYLRPIGSIYIDHMIQCVKEILKEHILENPEESGMTQRPVYLHREGLASVMYTEDRIC